MFLAVMTLLTLIVSPLMYVRAADDEDDEVPAPDVTHAKAAALYNVENDYFMYTKNADEQMYPASTVKLMTAIIVMEALGTDLDREITATREALEGAGKPYKDTARRGSDGAAASLRDAHRQRERRDEYLGYRGCRSIEAFVSMMNDKAEEIGATHTYYESDRHTSPVDEDDRGGHGEDRGVRVQLRDDHRDNVDGSARHRADEPARTAHHI